MSGSEEDSFCGTKKWWSDTNTRLLLIEFKKYYEFWRNGKINKKKDMWKKVAHAVNEKGYDCTAEQVENRIKTLQRSYRKSKTGLGSPRNIGELSHLFDNSLNTENSIDSNVGKEQKQSQNNLREEKNKSLITKSKERSHLKHSLQRKKANKNSVDVLLEIKELIKQVEIRRQMRHEECVSMAKERNEILKQKNKLLEQVILFSKGL